MKIILNMTTIVLKSKDMPREYWLEAFMEKQLQKLGYKLNIS